MNRKRPRPTVPASAALMTLVALLLAAAPGVAQSEPDETHDAPARRADHGAESPDSGDSDSYFDDAHRRRLYEEGKLEYSHAALWTALFPGLGNFYARQYFIGGVNATLMAFAAVLIPYGLSTSQSGFVWAGAGTVGTAYLSGFVTSYFGVKRFNRRLRRGLRVSGDPAGIALPPARGIIVGVRF